MILLSNKKYGFTEDKEIINLSWEEFEGLAKEISNDILKDKINKNKICLLAAARGALPLLTYISHKTGIRNVSVIQIQMTNSDTPYDYGKVRLLLEAIREEFEDFIILEDIIYKGNTIKEIINILKNKNKTIKKVYSLILDENYKSNCEYKIYSASLLKEEKWIKFPWE